MSRPLPRGRHGLTREFVEQDQRERLLAAIAGSLRDRGYDETTVSLIGSRARVSKSDFYRHFASKEECFVAAYDEAVERLRARLLAACEPGGEWADRVCAGLAEALACLAEEPAWASLLLVEGLRAGPEVYARFQVAFESFLPRLRAGAPRPKDGREAPPEFDEAVLGGAISLIARETLAGRAEGLAGIFPEVAEFVLSPYLGSAEARRIISAG
jgi:AcrR family transcriptional regulator